MTEQITLSGKDPCCCDGCDNIATEYTYDPERGERIGFICENCADICRENLEAAEHDSPDGE